MKIKIKEESKKNKNPRQLGREGCQYQELAEDAELNRMADERMENPKFVSVNVDDLYPMNFELRQGGKGVRPMSVDLLRDSASTRSQRRRNLKCEGYMS